MKIIFFGTPDFSVPFLNTLASDPQIELLAVVTQPDKPVGRKLIPKPSPIKERGQVLGFRVFPFTKLKSFEAHDQLVSLGADVFVVVAYGKLIPKSILDIPKLGCVNVHPSKLPRYRGPTPIQTAIEHGDRETAVSIMLLDEGMDTGPLLAQKKVEILPTDTTPSLSQRLAAVGAPFLVETLKLYAAGALTPIPQDNTLASSTKLLDRASGKIDWDESPEVIERKIRAYAPWPGTFTIIEHQGVPLRVKILKAKVVEGQFEILEVQPEGGLPMSYEAFVRGYGPLLPE